MVIGPTFCHTRSPGHPTPEETGTCSPRLFSGRLPRDERCFENRPLSLNRSSLVLPLISMRGQPARVVAADALTGQRTSASRAERSPQAISDQAHYADHRVQDRLG